MIQYKRLHEANQSRNLHGSQMQIVINIPTPRISNANLNTVCIQIIQSKPNSRTGSPNIEFRIARLRKEPTIRLLARQARLDRMRRSIRGARPGLPDGITIVLFALSAVALGSCPHLFLLPRLSVIHESRKARG